jgi:uncharacterized Zn-finger protein
MQQQQQQQQQLSNTGVGGFQRPRSHSLFQSNLTGEPETMQSPSDLFLPPFPHDQRPRSHSFFEVSDMISLGKLLSDVDSLTGMKTNNKNGLQIQTSPLGNSSPPLTPLSSYSMNDFINSQQLPQSIVIPSTPFDPVRNGSFDFSSPTSTYSPIMQNFLMSSSPNSTGTPEFSSDSPTLHNPYPSPTHPTPENKSLLTEFKPGKASSTSNGKSASKKVHACPFEGCDRKFTRLYNVKSHLICHSGERPHACTACPSSFRRKHDLQRHFRTTHSNIRPWTCATCSRSFARRDHYRRHVQIEESLAKGKKQDCADKAVAFHEAAI